MTYDALAPFLTFSLLMQQKTQLSAFVIPEIDYCNYLLRGSPIYMLEALPKVLIAAARLIFQSRKQNHI